MSFPLSLWIWIKKNWIIFMTAFSINTIILLVVPLIKSLQVEEGTGNSSTQQIKAIKINLDKPPPKKKKITLKERTPPKPISPQKISERFKLDLGIQNGLGSGAAIARNHHQNLIFKDGEVDVNPERIRGNPPQVPDQFAQLGLEGRVELEVVIDERGEVQETKALLENPRGYNLRERAEEAIHTWKFRPAMINRIPVKIRIIIPFIF